MMLARDCLLYAGTRPGPPLHDRDGDERAVEHMDDLRRQGQKTGLGKGWVKSLFCVSFQFMSMIFRERSGGSVV